MINSLFVFIFALSTLFLSSSCSKPSPFQKQFQNVPNWTHLLLSFKPQNIQKSSPILFSWLNQQFQSHSLHHIAPLPNIHSFLLALSDISLQKPQFASWIKTPYQKQNLQNTLQKFPPSQHLSFQTLNILDTHVLSSPSFQIALINPSLLTISSPNQTLQVIQALKSQNKQPSILNTPLAQLIKSVYQSQLAWGVYQITPQFASFYSKMSQNQSILNYFPIQNTQSISFSLHTPQIQPPQKIVTLTIQFFAQNLQTHQKISESFQFLIQLAASFLKNSPTLSHTLNQIQTQSSPKSSKISLSLNQNQIQNILQILNGI